MVVWRAAGWMTPLKSTQRQSRSCPGPNRGEEACSARHNDADFRKMVREKVRQFAEQDLCLRVKCVTARTSRKQQERMTQRNKQIAWRNEKADELALFGAEQDDAVMAETVVSGCGGDQEANPCSGE